MERIGQIILKEKSTLLFVIDNPEGHKDYAFLINIDSDDYTGPKETGIKLSQIELKSITSRLKEFDCPHREKPVELLRKIQRSNGRSLILRSVCNRESGQIDIGEYIDHGNEYLNQIVISFEFYYELLNYLELMLIRMEEKLRSRDSKKSESINKNHDIAYVSSFNYFMWHDLSFWLRINSPVSEAELSLITYVYTKLKYGVLPSQDEACILRKILDEARFEGYELPEKPDFTKYLHDNWQTEVRKRLSRNFGLNPENQLSDNPTMPVVFKLIKTIFDGFSKNGPYGSVIDLNQNHLTLMLNEIPVSIPWQFITPEQLIIAADNYSVSSKDTLRVALFEHTFGNTLSGDKSVKMAKDKGIDLKDSENLETIYQLGNCLGNPGIAKDFGLAEDYRDRVF